jgi:phage baseplate assembly protein W
MSGLAPRLPLTIDETDGAYSLIKEYVTLVKQNFKMLMLTSPGEKIMNPNYGVGLKRYLFENMISQGGTQSNVKARIYSQVERYMSYLDIKFIDFVQPDNSPNTLEVYIEYNIVPLNVDNVFDVTLDLATIF